MTPPPLPKGPLRAAVVAATAGLAMLLGGTGCGQVEDLLGPRAPAVEDLPDVVEPHAAALGRVSCGGCPERWEPRPCTFTESLLRTEDLQATRCAVVEAARGPHDIPDRLLPMARQRTTAARAAMAESRAPVEQALLLYSFGADLQRLGSLPLWRAGLEARTQALVVLAEVDDAGRWPADLLALEAAAPAPGRAADVGVLDTAARMYDPGWRERQALLMGSQSARVALRVRPAERADAMRTVRQRLTEALPEGRTDLDLLDAWEAAEIVRERSIAIALDSALQSRRQCPESLDALVPATLQSVPAGWQLDPRTCRAQHVDDPVPSRGSAPAPTAGAMAAPR